MADGSHPQAAPGAVLPVAGWYADPHHGGQLRWWDGSRWTSAVAPIPAPYGYGYGYGYAFSEPEPPLDRAVAGLRAENEAAWGWRPVIEPCAAAVVAIVAGTIATHVIHARTFDAQFIATIVINVGIYALLAAAVYDAGRGIAARHGGWGRTFGLRRPRLADLGYAGIGIAVALGARFVVAIAANALTNGRAVAQSQNLHLEHSANPVAVDVLLVVVVVILAPLVEETIFRGLLLRTFMRRLSFWPAALLSTFIFASFHTYEVPTLVGALTLAAIVATLGLTNCYLVRLTDRLAPGMIVHATFNALATLVLIYEASR